MLGLIVILLPFLSLTLATIPPYTPSPLLTYQSGARVCNVTNYFGTSTDLGVALSGAFSACVIGPSNARRDINSPQVVVMIPPGNYTISTTTTLRNGYNWFLHANGCYVTYRAGGYPFVIQGGSNLVISGDVAGTMDASKRGTLNGEAYLYPEHGSNLRLLKVSGVQNVIIGRLVLVQSPAFHLVVTGCSNVEIFETLINGPSYGGTDGMDIDGTNIYVHDCQVHNGDECVTMKSGTKNVLVERIFCDGTGGSEFGSFGEAATADPAAYGASIENVVYNNIYTVNSNVAFYMKACTTNNGLVRNVTLTNFILQNTAYPFGIDYYWMCNGLPQGTNGGGNLTFTDIRVSNFLGTMASASARPVIKLACGPSNVPGNAPTCTNIQVSNITVWGADGSTSMHNYCANAVGSGACLSSALASGAVTQTYTAKVGTIPPPSYGLIQYPLHVYPVYVAPPANATSSPTVDSPTTVVPAPTTLVPTPVSPTTLAPTTHAPTTTSPATLAPTTHSPTTVAPTTANPTTAGPTTLAPNPNPTTRPPTTVSPTTSGPTSTNHSTPTPTPTATATATSTDAPTTHSPTSTSTSTPTSTPTSSSSSSSSASTSTGTPVAPTSDPLSGGTGGNALPDTGSDSTTSTASTKSMSMGVIVGVAVGGGLLLLVLVGAFCRCYRRHSSKTAMITGIQLSTNPNTV